MNFPKIKKVWIILFGVILLLAILNPSLKDFHDHQGDKYGRRTGNYLICSTYESGNTTYLAFLLNFIEINKTEVVYTPALYQDKINNTNPMYYNYSPNKDKQDSLLAIEWAKSFGKKEHKKVNINESGTAKAFDEALKK